MITPLGVIVRLMYFLKHSFNPKVEEGNCFVVTSEKDNIIARDEIKYRKLGEVKTINLKSADEAKSNTPITLIIIIILI